MMARRMLAVAMTMLAATVTAGCVSIPTSSEVHAAGGVNVEDQSQPITNIVVGPSPGETPEQIVVGFYAAMLAYPQSTDTVVDFLTRSAASNWDPEARLTVYDDLLVVTGKSGASVTTTVSGYVDTRGTWTSRKAGAPPPTTDLKFQKVGGEWRISNPPVGTWVTTNYFGLYYHPLSLYFFDPSRTILTPDPIYLQVGDSTATQLVKALLLGPTHLLEGAVTTAVPADTELEVGVTVSDTGVADVPLSASILKVSEDDRAGVAAQLAWTLRQVAGISKIAITVDGADLTIPNTPSPFDADSFAGYDPAGLSGEQRLFALSPRGLVAISPDDTTPVGGPIGQVTGGSSFAVQTSGVLGAIVSGDRTTIRVGDMLTTTEATGAARWFKGTDLLRPSWDAVDVLWVVDQTSKGAQISTVTASGATRITRAPRLKGADIKAFAVSRDGVRFAAVVDRHGRSELDIATIVRDGRTVKNAVLRRPVVVSNAEVELTDIRDVAWVSPTSLAVLARVHRGDLQPFEVAIDGSDIQPAGGFLPVQPTSIAAAPNTAGRIAVGTGDGKVYIQNSDRAWDLAGTTRHLSAPAYPG